MCRLMVANGLISFANGFFFPGFVVRWRGGQWGRKRTGGAREGSVRGKGVCEGGRVRGRGV